MFLGDDLLAWMTLAIGGAMAVGNVLAVVKPPPQRRNDADLVAAPKARSLFFALVGLIAAVWAIATLVSSDPADDGIALQLNRTTLDGADDLSEPPHPQPERHR